MGKPIYLEEKLSLYRLNHLANLALNDKPFLFTQTDKSNKSSTIKIKTINISQDEGIYITGTITNDSGVRLQGDSDDKLTIVGKNYFKNNKKLRERLIKYMTNRPRMKVIPTTFNVGGEQIIESKVMCLFINDSDKSGTLTSYEVVELFDSESKFIKQTMNLAKDYEARQMIYIKKTVQGRFNDQSMYNAMTLALYGYTRGVIKDDVIYSRVVENGVIKTRPLAVSAYKYYGYNDCEVGERVEFERFACPIRTTRHDNDRLTYIKVANILGYQEQKDSHHDVIARIREYSHGLVYLKNTIAEEVVSLIYDESNTSISNKKEVNDTIFGYYITHKGESLNYTNPDVEVVPIAYDNILKEAESDISNTNSILRSRLGSTDYSMDFYIIDVNVSVDEDILASLCENSLVFVLSEFNNLCGIARRFKDTSIDLNNVIFMGSLYDQEGIFMHPYLKQLIEDDNYTVLNQIPMSMGKKASDGTWLGYDNMIGNILTKENDVSNIILTNYVQVVKNGNIYPTTTAFDSLTYGELLRIYMNLTTTNIFKTMNSIGICNVVCNYSMSVKKKDKWSIRKIPLKMTVTEMRNVNDKPPLKIAFKPITLAGNASYSQLSSLYTSTVTGLDFLCGDPGSGKKYVVHDICRSIPNKGSVLIFDSEYEITEQFFKNENDSDAMALDLTISRSHNASKIENLLMTRPNVIIVFKLSSYEIGLLNQILNYYNPSQKVIIVYDGLFTDILDKLDVSTANRVLDCLTLATNQIRVSRGRDGKRVSIYECIDSDLIMGLALDRNGPDVRSISGGIYNHMKDDSQGLHRQIAELLRDSVISQSVAQNCLNVMKRHYFVN